MLTMSRQPPARGEMDRKQFVGDADVLAALGVTVEELADPDVRSVVIRHEHPEFEEAVKEHLYEIDLGDGPMNPRLHLAMHEIVATQLWDNSSASRLMGTGAVDADIDEAAQRHPQAGSPERAGGEAA